MKLTYGTEAPASNDKLKIRYQLIMDIIFKCSMKKTKQTKQNLAE